MSKCGTGPDHCCYFQGVPCEYVIAVDKPPFKWACSLRVEHGNWDDVHKDERYVKNVKPKMAKIPGGGDCGDWEGRCGDCGMGID